MKRLNSEGERTGALWLAKENEGADHISGKRGELMAYLILLAVLFALVTKGWV